MKCRKCGRDSANEPWGVMPPLEGDLCPPCKQKRAQQQFGYGQITLKRLGNQAVVSIEVDGKELEVIREDLDGNFCHTIHPLGIESLLLGEA